MSLDFNELKWLLFVQIQTLPLSMHHKWKEITDLLVLSFSRTGLFVGSWSPMIIHWLFCKQCQIISFYL